MLARGFSHFLCLRNGINDSPVHGIHNSTGALIFRTSKRCRESEVRIFSPNVLLHFYNLLFTSAGTDCQSCFVVASFQSIRSNHNPYLPDIKNTLTTVHTCSLMKSLSVKKKIVNITSKSHIFLLFTQISLYLSFSYRFSFLPLLVRMSESICLIWKDIFPWPLHNQFFAAPHLSPSQGPA